MAQAPNPNRSGVQVLSDNNTDGSRIGEEGHIFTGRNQQGKGASIVSATSIVLGKDGNYFELTGSATVNDVSTEGWQEGSQITFEVPPAVTLSNSGGNIRLTGGNSFSPTSTGGSIVFILFSLTNVSAAWRELSRASYHIAV